MFWFRLNFCRKNVEICGTLNLPPKLTKRSVSNKLYPLLLSCGGSGSQSASPSRGLISSAVKNAVIPSNARNVTLPNKGAAPSESKSSGSSIAPDVAQEVVIDASKSDATLRLVDSSPTTASPTTIAFTPSEPNPTSTSQPFPVQIPTPIDVAPPNVVFTR